MTPAELKKYIKDHPPEPEEKCPKCGWLALIKTVGIRTTKCSRCKYIFRGNVAKEFC